MEPRSALERSSQCVISRTGPRTVVGCGVARCGALYGTTCQKSKKCCVSFHRIVRSVQFALRFSCWTMPWKHCSPLLLPTLLLVLCPVLQIHASTSTKSPLQHPSRTKLVRRVLDTCDDELLTCRMRVEGETDGGEEDLDDMILQAVALRQSTSSDDETTKISPQTRITNTLKSLQGLFYQVAGEDGPLATIGYLLSQQRDGLDFSNVLGFLNPLEIGDSFIAEWIAGADLPPILSVVGGITSTLFPNFSLATILSEVANTTTGAGPTTMNEQPTPALDTTVAELRSLVAKAKEDQKLGEKDVRLIPDLVSRLFGLIFFLGPKDLADILTLPFLVLGRKNRVEADGHDEDVEKERSAISKLLSVPVVVLTTRYVVARLFPDLLLTDLVPDIPLLNNARNPPCSTAHKDFQEFANETLMELGFVLENSNITNTTGMLADVPEEVGQSVLELVESFADVEAITLSNFLDDPIITGVRLAVAALLATTTVASRLSVFHLPTTTAILTPIIAAVGLNVTETLPFFNRLIGLPVFAIVAEGFPPLKRLLDGFDLIVTNMLQIIFPNALAEMETVFSDNFAPGGFSFSRLFSGFGCRIALASCSTKNFLTEALGAELLEIETEDPTTATMDTEMGDIAGMVESGDETAENTTQGSDAVVTEVTKAVESGSGSTLSCGWAIMVPVTLFFMWLQ